MRTKNFEIMQAVKSKIRPKSPPHRLEHETEVSLSINQYLFLFVFVIIGMGMVVLLGVMITKIIGLF